MAKIQINTINHQSMPMRNRTRALGFWRDLLGLKVIPAQESGDGLIWMQASDGTMVHLVQRHDDDTPNIHTAFEVDDFDEALTAMSEAGYEIIKGPLERADGQRAFYVYDPEGNRVEFTTKSGLKSSERVVDENGYTTS
jgi:catechol 2,3-dioxygenase-like lactoylglutathione lyase family enzyme|tara:strand:- start:374 stop:790 length:417 start_codon:yes stop_codon:yes gene_type:complete